MPRTLRLARNTATAVACATREECRRAAQDRRARHERAGLGEASHRRRCESVNSRAALAKLPVLRKADVAALQKAIPPFGGFNVTPPDKARRLLMSPGPIFEPEGEGEDRYGAARALFCRRIPCRRHRA